MRLCLWLLLFANTLLGATFDELMEKAARAATREATFLGSVACTESVVESKLDVRNKPESQSKRSYDYFALIDLSEGDLSVNESRIEQGKARTNKQLLQSTGFAMLSLIFHPFFQTSFTFSDDGTEHAGNVVWHKIGFQYRPGKRSPTLLRTGAREYPISWAGEAWVDEQTGRVARIHANVVAQLDEIGIKSMEANVRYGSAENLGENAEWVPLDAVVDLRTPHQHWRNTHTFGEFRKFEVSTVEQKKSSPK